MCKRYQEETCNKILKLRANKVKFNKLEQDIDFLKQCKIKRVLPNFTKIKLANSNHFVNARIDSNKLYYKTSARHDKFHK